MRNMITCAFLLVHFSIIGQNPVLENLWKGYQSQSYDEVIEKATPYLEVDSMKVDVNLLVGRCYADKGEFQAAIPFLQYTADNDLHRNWRKAWALGYLGNCHFMLDNYEQAKESTLACMQLNATRNATRYAYNRALLFGFEESYKDWKIRESDHFRFHFQDMSDPHMESFIKSREAAFQRINEFFGSEVPKKIDFFVWNSRDDAKRILNANLGFAKPVFCVLHSHYRQTPGHEISHVISHYSTQIVRKTGLINEGTAVCFDQTTQDREEMVKDWINTNKRPISIHKVWKNWSEYPEQVSYPMAGLFVKELIDQFGRDQYILFFADQTFEHAKTIFGDKLDELIAAFEKKINN